MKTNAKQPKEIKYYKSEDGNQWKDKEKAIEHNQYVARLRALRAAFASPTSITQLSTYNVDILIELMAKDPDLFINALEAM